MRPFFHSSLALVLAACGASPSNTASNSADGVSEQQAEARAAPNQGRPFRTVEVARFDEPWAMDFLPGSGLPLTNTALVTDKGGTLWLIDVASGRKQQVSGIPSVRYRGQGGLGDVVAHPHFAGNQRIYLSFAEAGPDETAGAAIGYGTLVLGEVQPRLENFKVIWRQEPKVTGAGHYAHRIAFAPDGTMFVSSGDRQKMQPAQDRNSDLGKVIHMTDEGGRLGGRFYTMGHRNILGLAFAPDGRLWASEMGPRGGDEINLIVQGRNYGWPEVSYGSHYRGGEIPDEHRSRNFEEPKLWWNPSVSPAGMIIYSGNQFPRWRGDIIAGALSGQALLHIHVDGDRATKANRWDMGARIREVAQGPDGSVYILEDGRDPGEGRLLKLTPVR